MRHKFTLKQKHSWEGCYKRPRIPAQERNNLRVKERNRGALGGKTKARGQETGTWGDEEKASAEARSQEVSVIAPETKEEEEEGGSVLCREQRFMWL